MIHLGYCTNVKENFSAPFWARVRAATGQPTLGLGLYLGRDAVDAVDATALGRTLDDAGLYAFTFNAFPYGNFHGERVKEAVYRPAWTDPRRTDYTLAVARLLTELAPPSVARPTLSTVPLGFRLSPAELDASARALVEVADALSALSRPLLVCLEPEPGCALERAADVVRFFDGPLERAARGRQERVRCHIGVCFDVCHHAVLFEDPTEVIECYARAQISVGKVQVSCALALPDPRDAAARAALYRFDEPRYLHQTCDGRSSTLELAAAETTLARDQAWRSHFHVPIDRAGFGSLGTTQGDLERALARLAESELSDQFECETYTWSVLPPHERPDDDEALALGIARELAWARARLPGLS
jgi:hypothetical protein